MPTVYERITKVTTKQIVTQLFFEGRDNPSTQTDPLDPEDMPPESYFAALDLLKTTAIDMLTAGSFNVSSEWMVLLEVSQVEFNYLDSSDLPDDAMGLSIQCRLVLPKFGLMKLAFPRIPYRTIESDPALANIIATIQAEAAKYLETLRKNPKKQQLSLLDSAA
jgi:hypothetical protein